MTHNQSDKKKLVSNVLFNTFYQILLVITPLITAPYVSRVLHADGVGVYSFAHSLVTYFTLIAALGTVSYGTREIARNRDIKQEYSKTFWEIEIIVILTSIVSLGFWLLLSFTYKEYKIFLLIFSFQIIAVIFDISWLYAGLEKFKYTVTVNSIFKILSIVAIFLLVKSEKDLWIFILVQSGAILGGNLSMWLFLPKTICKAKIEKTCLKRHFKETLFYFIPAIATSIYTVLDKTFIGLLIPGTTTVIENGKEVTKKISELENGYYEQATKLINMVKSVCFAGIVGVMSSRASHLYKDEKEDEAMKVLHSTFEVTSLLSLGACFGLIGVASNFVPIFFGPGYDKTISIIYIICALPFIISISNVVGSIYYTPSGRRKKSTIYILIGSAINIVLNIPLILLLKSYGAAIASVIAELVISILYIVNCRKMITFKDILKMIWKKLIGCLLMLGSIILLSFLLKDLLNSIVLLAVEITVGASIYLLTLFLLKDSSIKNLTLLINSKFKKQDVSV